MFIVAQLPFGDFRPLITGGMGRLDIPDWTSDNLNSGFVRGFGKISPRNGSSLGLGGERAFADINNAVRFMEPIEYRPANRNLRLRLYPWFRRLYFDGTMAGRFEFGFNVDANQESMLFDSDMANEAINPSLLAQVILSTQVLVNSADGSKETRQFANIAQALGYAYIAATTDHRKLSQFPIPETFGFAVFIGKPMLHIRISSDHAIETQRDRRLLNSEDEPELFITSAIGSETRNNVLVQASKLNAGEESASERITRVLFAHLNALLFAHAQFVKSGPKIGGANKRVVFRATVERILHRFERVRHYTDSTDVEFVAGMQRFSSAYTGRIDELVEKLEALSEEWKTPTTTERFKAYFSGVHDLTLKTVVETTTKTALKGGP